MMSVYVNRVEPPLAPLNPGVWKRKGSDNDEDNDDLSQLKRPRCSWYVTLKDESSGPTDNESDESIYSVQNVETEYAKNTSDTSDSSSSLWSLNDSRKMTIDVEYEPVTSPDDENPMNGYINSSSSDSNEFLSVNLMAVTKIESDIKEDQVEESDTSLDSELGKADYWSCIQCKAKNNNPLFRYCERCYQLRKNFFPPRPKRKKRNLPSSNTEGESSQNSAVSRIDSGLGSQNVFTDGDPSSQNDNQSSQLTQSDKQSLNGDSPEHLKQGEENKTDDESDFVRNIELLGDRLKSHEEIDSKYCLVCTVNPKNGVFVHGHASHICCCYRCAVKVWKKQKHCPICNRKVTNVLKAFYV